MAAGCAREIRAAAVTLTVVVVCSHSGFGLAAPLDASWLLERPRGTPTGSHGERLLET